MNLTMDELYIKQSIILIVLKFPDKLLIKMLTLTITRLMQNRRPWVIYT